MSFYWSYIHALTQAARSYAPLVECIFILHTLVTTQCNCLLFYIWVGKNYLVPTTLFSYILTSLGSSGRTEPPRPRGTSKTVILQEEPSGPYNPAPQPHLRAYRTHIQLSVGQYHFYPQTPKKGKWQPCF